MAALMRLARRWANNYIVRDCGRHVAEADRDVEDMRRRMIAAKAAVERQRQELVRQRDTINDLSRRVLVLSGDIAAVCAERDAVERERDRYKVTSEDLRRQLDAVDQHMAVCDRWAAVQEDTAAKRSADL